MSRFPQVVLDATPPAFGPAPDGFTLGVRDGVFVIVNPDGDIVGGDPRPGTPVNGVKAVQTLTSTGVAPSNGQTVTIGSVVYTFQTTLTNVANNVLIGVSAAVALDNLKSAINRTAGAGTTYAAATVAHPQVSATTNTDTTQVIEALNPGPWSHNIPLAENSATLSWGGGGLLAGGVNPTQAKAGTRMYDSSYNYIAVADVTATSTSGWRRSATSSY